MEPDGPGARLAGLGAERAPDLLTDFEQIYQSGAVKPPRICYGVLKVAEMLNSSHLCGMPAESKRAAETTLREQTRLRPTLPPSLTPDPMPGRTQ